MKTLIYNAEIINEGCRFRGALLIEGDCIREVFEGDGYARLLNQNEVSPVDAHGAVLIPGVIDEHVHFREPGMTQKADIAHESRAALAGGVTSVMDMPNVVPQTTTLERWEERMAAGARESRVNYAYYLGATNNNLCEIQQLDPRRIPAVKLFMGSSTGNMLVDKREVLQEIFHHCPTLIMAHCEDTNRIIERMAIAERQWGEDPVVCHHPWIRDDEACYRSSQLAVEMATESGARLHIAHITTERELSLLNNRNITGEVCVAHLLFCDEDYDRLGTRIKCNPAVKSRQDRDALRQAIRNNRILTVATDHAPHLIADKQGGCRKAASGMPMVQFSLPAMMNLVEEGVISVERLVELMCHNPAQLFGIEQRGFLRPGYKADFTLLKHKPWTLNQQDILSKCGWSPLEGYTFQWKVTQTYLNGQLAYDYGNINDTLRGEALRFQTPPSH